MTPDCDNCGKPSTGEPVKGGHNNDREVFYCKGCMPPKEDE